MEISREDLNALAQRPIGGDVCSSTEAARRAGKIWLPLGKTSASSGEAREARRLLKEKQIDLEDAVEAAGGQRGHMGRN